MSVSLEIMIAQEREALMKLSDQELIRQFLDLGRQFAEMQILLNNAKEASKAVDEATNVEMLLEETDKLIEQTNEEPEMKTLNEESFKNLRENLDEKLSNLLEEEIMDTTEESQNCNPFEETREPIQPEEAASESIENFRNLEVKLSTYGTNIEKRTDVEKKPAEEIFQFLIFRHSQQHGS